jgi:hypothetical protein
VPVSNAVFGTHPMGMFQWALVLGFSALFSLVIAVEKRFHKGRLAGSADSD